MGCYVAKRSNQDDIELFHEKGVHIPSRTIYFQQDDTPDEIGSEIGPKAAERLIKNLHVLTFISNDPIKIVMNTQGGSVYDGLAIYDAINNCPAHITITALGCVMSMGVIVLQAADHRVAYPFTRLMAHDGEDSASGHTRDFEKAGDESRVIRLNMYAILAKHTGKPASYWSRKLSRDYYMSAQQALSEGLLDEVITNTEL